MIKKGVLVLVLLAAGALMGPGGSIATAGGGWSDADCGDIVTTDVRLTGDLDCEGAGLIVGADGITIDLNGYTISCASTGYWGIDNSDGYDGVTIRNGTIEGFDEAVRSEDGDDLVVRNVDVVGANGPSASTGAIHVLGGSGVTIRNCTVAVTAAFLGPHGIRLDSVEDVVVQNTEVDGSFIGISFFSIGGVGDPTTGRIQNCTIEGCAGGGVLLASTDDAKVLGCEIASCSVGVQVGFSQYQSNVQISRNYIHDHRQGGLLCYLIEDSVFSDNVIEDNARYGFNVNEDTESCRISGNEITGNGLRGLVLTYGANDNRITENDVSDNGVEGITLFLGTNTGNVINDNTATDNGVWDLYHNATSTPNTWNDNTYDTAFGDDID